MLWATFPYQYIQLIAIISVVVVVVVAAIVVSKRGRGWITSYTRIRIRIRGVIAILIIIQAARIRIPIIINSTVITLGGSTTTITTPLLPLPKSKRG